MSSLLGVKPTVPHRMEVCVDGVVVEVVRPAGPASSSPSPHALSRGEPDEDADQWSSTEADMCQSAHDGPR